MAHPLDDARARVVRAHEHFETLKAEFDALPADAKTITLASNFDAKTNHITVTIATVPEYPRHWSLLISEMLFNLRSALEYLVWELAKWNVQQQGKTGDPPGKTYFSMAASEEQFNEGHVKALNRSHVAMLKWLQPYSQGFMSQYASLLSRGVDMTAATENHVGMKLHKLNNRDKHQALLPTFLATSGIDFGQSVPPHFDCEITGSNIHLKTGIDLDVGAVWAEFDVIPSGPDPRVEMPVDIQPGIGVERTDLLTAFPLMETWVSAVLDMFQDTWTPFI